MKKILPAILILAVAGIGGYYLYSTKMKPSGNPGPQSTIKTISEAAQLSAAIKNGTPTYCVMTRGSDKMEYWVKGKMFKMDSSSSDKVAHIINDGVYMYSWSGDSKQGFKSKLDTTAVPSAASPIAVSSSQPTAPTLDSESGYNDLKSEGYTIDCQGTTLADSAFIPPVDVTFTDPSEMMKAVTPSGSAGAIDMQKIQELQKKYGSTAPAPAGDY